MRYSPLSVVILAALPCVIASTAYSGNLLLMIALLLGKKSSSYEDMNTAKELMEHFRT